MCKLALRIVMKMRYELVKKQLCFSSLFLQEDRRSQMSDALHPERFVAVWDNIS